METAFYLYDLTDEIPDEYSVATKREAAPITDLRVKQYFVPKEILRLGETVFDYKGYLIPIYDRERMLVELVRYKPKLPYNYYKGDSSKLPQDPAAAGRGKNPGLC